MGELGTGLASTLFSTGLAFISSEVNDSVDCEQTEDHVRVKVSAINKSSLKQRMAEPTEYLFDTRKTNNNRTDNK